MMPAGAETVVTGQWVPRDARSGRASGVLVARSMTPPGPPSGISAGLRNAVTGRADRLYGPRAPLVGALVLGTRGEIDAGMRDDFAFSGLVHLLSISGFHVGLLSAWVVLIARLCRMRRPLALATGAVVGGAYVVFLGWPAPAARAAALAALLAVSFVRQRRVEADAVLAQTCLIVMAIDPWSVLDLGGWLSVAALWGATTATRWSDRAIGEGFLARTLSSSIGATVATAPITAATLGAVAVAGIGLNIAAIPAAAVAVPGVAASLLAEPLWGRLAEALAAGSGLALHSLEVMASVGARVPGGHAVVAAEARSAIPWLALLAATLWVTGRRNTRREATGRLLALAAGGAWLWLAVAVRPLAGDAVSGLTLHFLDVGQGDGAVIRTPAGRWIVIDAGPRSDRFDAGRRVMAPFLARRGVRRLTVVVISHAHLDHLGGIDALLRRFPADLVLDPAAPVADPIYAGFLGALAATGTPWRPARAGLAFEVDGVRFSVMHPDTTWHEWGDDVNEDSIVLRVEYGGFSALFTGDAGLPAEARLAGRIGPVDLLKVGHHGSRGATGGALLGELDPRAAIISVGRNRYGHPSPEALERLGRTRADLWRTDEEGDVSVTTDGITMTVRGHRGSVTYPVQ
jgi:competence protein ComEC